MRIEAKRLNKVFKTPVVRKGRFSGFRTLFSREYRVHEAVRDISFEVESGEFVGYIGPNGAGKSTTIKMLTGILHPTGGEVLLGGISPHRERRKTASRLGVVFGQRSQLWWDLPVIDSYDILARMYRVGPGTKAKRLKQFAELLDLPEFWHTPVRKLSLGQRMRADLAAAMLHDPELLFLDEPTIGLDVNAKRSIREFLKLLNSEFGKTILLTTHDMDDIEQLCGRVMVISGGELTYDGTVRSLRDKIGLPTRFHVTYRGECVIPEKVWLHSEAEEGTAGDWDSSCSKKAKPGDSERLFNGGVRVSGMPLTENSGQQSGMLFTGELALAAASEESLRPAPTLSIAAKQGNTVIVEANRQEMRTMDVLRELSSWGEIEDIVMEEPDFEEVIHRVYK